MQMCKSSFTFTFALEIIDNEIWTDFAEGLLDLEQPIHTYKLNYLLYPEYPPCELIINVWHHCAKIIYIGQVCWVRTWLFLDRRWLTFSISHLIIARVDQLLSFKVSVQPGVPGTKTDHKGADHKGPDHKGTQERKGTLDKADHAHQLQVYIPPVKRGEQRYFAPVFLPQEEVEQETIGDFVVNMLDEIIKSFVPLTMYDGVFEQPHPVSDVRHQDAVIYHIRELTLNKKIPTLYDPPMSESSDNSQSPRGSKKPRSKTGTTSKDKQRKKSSKDKDVKKTVPEKDKKGKDIGPKTTHIYELIISGNDILAGAGRIVQLNVQNVSERPRELGEVMALLSTKSLPAPDDTPVFFVNVESLNQIPVKEFEEARINDLRICWRFGDKEHSSQRHMYTSGNADFCDHVTVPLYPEIASEMVSSFLDNPFEIEIHGFRNPEKEEEPTLFGYHPKDVDFNTKIRPPKLKEESCDVIIAVCKIDLQPLAIGTNGLVRGDFSLEAPAVSFAPLKREALCTNDFNATKSNVVPELVVQPYTILESQLSLNVSIGLVGCKPRDTNKCYSRFFCIIKQPDHVVALLTEITEANEFLIACEKKYDLLTGFVLDTGSEVFVYLEGPRDGQILRIWELSEDFYRSVSPVFSTFSRYASRIYPDLLAASVPVIVLKMHVPLNCLLACPPLYTRPGAPLPSRAAILKIGRIIASELYYPPTSGEMPTILEMRSFRLEFCSPPKLITTWPDQNQNIKLFPDVASGRLSKTLPLKFGNVMDNTK